MDIIDDLVVVVRLILDYIGIDPEDVRALLEELNARRRVRFYQTRHAITYNWNHVVSFRQRTINRVNKIQSDVRHKSLMRIIGSYISMKPVKRVRIQNHLLQSRYPKYMYDSDSDDSVISTTSLGTSTDDDVVWVEEELGDNCVRIRAQKRKHFENDAALDELDADLCISRPSLSPMSSTMISSVSTRQDPEQTQKLSVMEEELNNLRLQIAMLVEAQEQINKSHIPVPPQSFQEERLPIEDNVPVPPPCPIAPPPPPPLPATKQSTPIVTQTATEKQTIVLQTIQDNRNSTPENPPKQATLTDVLKGLGSVKLKSIQRSPGGTPLKPRRRESNNDPASVIAQALKKKFANQIINSPDVDKENDSFNFSSPEPNSPFNIGSGHRRIRKRSVLFDDKNRLSGPLRL
ncbi:mitochondrial fission regulator 2-like [Mytilus californianus]|uniref:mitochondrial fission regulator 2-like n=1 Tax=Mytilus californianus TaxID=6549 RepID=UPI0022468C65|nr:mitochondrial fission regulator 2-like [Mytilus californianus]